MRLSDSKALCVSSFLPNPQKRKIGRGGYIYISIPDHPNRTKDGYYLEHRFIVEKYLGRLLDRKEAVHHVDHNPANNKINNLIVYKSSGQHLKHEHNIKNRFGQYTKPGKITLEIKKGIYKNCLICKKKFYLLPSRKKYKFCSRKCMGKSYKNRPAPWMKRPRSLETRKKMSQSAKKAHRNKLGKFIHSSPL